MRQFFMDMITGKDNLTVDLFRILSALSVLVALGLECYSVLIPGHPFDLQAYGVGVGAVLLSAGGALKLKADTEPEPEVPPK